MVYQLRICHFSLTLIVYDKGDVQKHTIAIPLSKVLKGGIVTVMVYTSLTRSPPLPTGQCSITCDII